MALPKTGMKSRAPYDDISADYTAYYPDRPQDLKSTIQKEQLTSKENVTHSINSGKCGTFTVRNQKLKSNRGPERTSLVMSVGRVVIHES